MMRFANIEFLWGLVLIPVLVFVYLYVARWKRKALAGLGDRTIVRQIMPDVSLRRPLLKFLLFLLAFFFLIIGLADPQIGSKMEEVKRTGSEIMVLLDVSNSMLAEDLSPNRLENAKRSIALLIDNLRNDKIGIIVFAGQAYVQLPVTTDYAAAKLFLNTINTNMVPTQGTAIGTAINMGMRSFDFKNGLAKAMVVITDGENHEDDAVAAAKIAREKDVIIHVLGIGSSQGAPIPIYDNGKQVGFRTDSTGKTVVTKLNEETGKEIAEVGGGAYVRASNANGGLGIIKSEIDRLQKKTYGSKMFKDFEDRFQIFLGMAFLLLAAEFFISNRKSLKFSNLKLFEVKKNMKSLVLPVLMLFQVSLLFAQKEKSYIHKGNKLYNEGKFKEAEETYRKSVAKKNVLPEGNFNLGDALYKQKKFTDAAGKFSEIASSTKNKQLAAGSYHNLGNSLFQEKKLEESIEAYKKALRTNPSDDQTRYNLAYAQQMLKKQQEQKKNDDKNKDDKNKDNKDKKDDKNKDDKNKDKKDDKNKDDKNKDKKDEKDKGDKDQEKPQQQPQPQPDQVSKEDAERMLEALNNQEQATQEKLKNQKLKGVKVKISKDW